MNLRRLSEFLAVAEYGNIGAAADHLEMSQPGLSKSIRRLEEELSVRLFDRLPRGVRLTIYGELLKESALNITSEATRLRSEIQSINEGISGTVRAGAGADWLFRVVPRAVAEIQESSPGVRVKIWGGFNDELQSMLLARELDFCLATLPKADFDAKLKFDHWISDSFHIVARRGHPIHQRKDLTLGDLSEYPWALPMASPVLRQRLDELFLSNGLEAPNPVLETNYMSLCLSAMRTNGYLGWVTDLQLKRAENLELIPIAVAGGSVQRKAGLIRRRGEMLNPAARKTIATLRRVCEDEFGGIQEQP